jgi:formylglycine-generating enzyme required for sulfatase activity
MGNDNEAEKQTYSDEFPAHRVYLDTYWIDKTEVTNAMYVKCLKAGKCAALETGFSEAYDKPGKDNYPVRMVNWNQAKAYCQWAGRDLPTEAQWEKAARGADGRIYPWGNDWKENLANQNGDVLPVGTYPAGASPYGVLDMAGNVWEWVKDWYAYDYYASSPEKNPSGPTKGEVNIIRGGSSGFSIKFLRTVSRQAMPPENDNSIFGIRCVLNP